MTSRLVSYLLWSLLTTLCYAEVNNVPNSNEEQARTHIRSPRVVPKRAIPTNIRAIDAASIESSVAGLQTAFASIPGIALPSGILPHKDVALARIAGLMPPLQTAIASAPAKQGMTFAERQTNDDLERLSQLEQESFVQNLTQLLEDLRPPPPETPGKILAGRQSSIRVMVVGDSISQGQQGDWTWRYRIWQWFQSQGISVQMVGPYPGTFQPLPPSPPQPPPLYNAATTTTSSAAPLRTTGKYAIGVDSAFLTSPNHFAIWGRAAATDQGLIAGVLQSNPADLMLLMLGFNDIGWFYSDAQGALQSIYNLIQNARAINPSMAFVVADIPMRTSLGAGRADLPVKTNEFNEALPRAISSWDSPQSRVVLAPVRANYECELDSCPAGYDGLHPNAYGEYQIAHAFSIGLHNGLGLGSGILAVPDQSAIPVRPLPAPSNLQVSASPGGILATWDPVFGAYSYDVNSVITNIPAFSGIASVSSNRYDGTWTVAGLQYNIQVLQKLHNVLSALTAR